MESFIVTVLFFVFLVGGSLFFGNKNKKYMNKVVTKTSRQLPKMASAIQKAHIQKFGRPDTTLDDCFPEVKAEHPKPRPN